MYGPALRDASDVPARRAAQTGPMDDLETLRRRVKRAIERRDDAVSFSPDWDAAMSELDELRADSRFVDLRRRERDGSATA